MPRPRAIEPTVHQTKCFFLSLCVALLPSGLVAHSGGLNSQGCHSGFHPYHCRRSGDQNTPSAGKEIIQGTVTKVRDGDTFVIGDQPIRLAAVDCPENDTREGQRASALLTSIILSKRVTCELTGAQTYDRSVAYCTINGRDLGELLFESTQCQVWERYDVWDRY
jgi:endonuclease YncB( thermonuclease family)